MTCLGHSKIPPRIHGWIYCWVPRTLGSHPGRSSGHYHRGYCIAVVTQVDEGPKAYDLESWFTGSARGDTWLFVHGINKRRKSCRGETACITMTKSILNTCFFVLNVRHVTRRVHVRTLNTCPIHVIMYDGLIPNEWFVLFSVVWTESVVCARDSCRWGGEGDARRGGQQRNKDAAVHQFRFQLRFLEPPTWMCSWGFHWDRTMVVNPIW